LNTGRGVAAPRNRLAHADFAAHAGVIVAGLKRMLSVMLTWMVRLTLAASPGSPMALVAKAASPA